MKPTLIRLQAAAACIVGLALTSGAAMAHATLDRALPRVGSSVQVAPERVELWFSEALEPAFSTVKVVDSGGRQVDRGDPSVDERDRAHLSVSMPPLLAGGRYRVVWRAVSRDAHVTSGDFVFEVAP
jgi:methionine-rich copper-binding protein CopC